MSVTKSDVMRLGTITKIALCDDELEILVKDLSKTIEDFEQLKKLDTKNVEPTIDASGLKNIFREDIVEPQVPREKLLELAPEVLNNQVKVPKVL